MVPLHQPFEPLPVLPWCYPFIFPELFVKVAQVVKPTIETYSINAQLRIHQQLTGKLHLQLIEVLKQRDSHLHLEKPA